MRSLTFLIQTLRLCDYWLTYLYIYICTVSISNNYGKFSETEINYNKGPFFVCIRFNFFKRQAMIKIDSFFFYKPQHTYMQNNEKKNWKKKMICFVTFSLQTLYLSRRVISEGDGNNRHLNQLSVNLKSSTHGATLF